LISHTLCQRDLLEARYLSALLGKSEGTVLGQKCWWLASPVWIQGTTKVVPDEIVLELYERTPSYDVRPKEVVPIARRRVDGQWEAQTCDLKMATGQTKVLAILDGARVIRVDFTDSEKPPLELLLAPISPDIGAA